MTPLELGARWERLAGTSRAARSTGDDLLRRWAEPHRCYHTLEHLHAVLDAVDDLLPSEPAASGLVVELAAWFHDAVYEPRRPDNEDASARLARTALPGFGISGDVAGRVAALVRMTATHDPSDADGRVLADADLAVLARPRADYDAYVAAVRAEYAFVPDDGWRRGRAAVLTALLARSPLYRTAPMRAREEQARSNMGRELAALAR